ncbi:MAG: tetratricopeptide repeat protein [Myxococcota bacterium]
MASQDMTLPVDGGDPIESLEGGQLFGRYLIVDRVGAGGVGEVFAAYDPTLDRRVALKVMRISPGGSSSSHGEAGLVREAKALASLSHPNVVTVHEVGREDGRVYVAMELVDGRDLEAWIAERPDRPWKETLAVFLDAGKGLAAAHARDILHRDFKPANVLIGHDDWVRVSDFGLARMLTRNRAETLATADLTGPSLQASLSVDGRMVGTPYFMAPEQLEGESTVRSDVYAFCLALRDALYGVRTFPTDSFLELVTLKSTAKPTPPDDARGVPSLVRAAIERGLATDPQARWTSMDELLTELRRALQPPSRSALPWVVGLGGLAVAGAVFTLDGATTCTGAAEALAPTWTATRAEDVSRGLLDSGSPIGADTAERIRPRLEAYADAWTTAHVQVCEATQRGAQSDALLDQRMTCLQRQRLSFGAVLDVLESADAEVVRRAVQVADRLPTPSECVSKPAADAPETSPAIEAARAEQSAIRALISAGKYDLAAAQSEALVETAEALDAPKFFADVLYTRGEALYQIGRVKDAVTILERANVAAVALGDIRTVRNTALMLIVVESEAGNPTAGLRWSRQAEPAIEALGDEPSDRVVLHTNRGIALAEKGSYAEAQAEVERALEDEARATPLQRVQLLRSLSGALFYQGHLDEAIETHEQVLRLSIEQLGPEHPTVAMVEYNLGTFLMTKGVFEQADARLARALEIQRRSLPPNHTDIADTLNSIGASAYQQRRIKDAIGPMEQAYEIKRLALSDTHQDVLESRVNIAVLRTETGEYERAAEDLEDVLRRIDGDENVPATTKSSALFNLARLRLKQERIEDAASLYEAVLKLDESRLEPDDPRLASTLIGLGVLRKQQDRPEAALELYERAFSIQEAKLAPGHPGRLSSLNNITSTLLLLERPAKARATAERMLRDAKGFDEYTARATFLLAQALRAEGKRARARSLGADALTRYRAVETLTSEVAEVEAFVAAR